MPEKLYWLPRIYVTDTKKGRRIGNMTEEEEMFQPTAKDKQNLTAPAYMHGNT